MISEQARFPNDYLKTSVYIGRRDDGEISGAMMQDAAGRAWSFSSLIGLIDLYERLFDSLNFPQSTVAMRSFNENAASGKGNGDLQKERINLNELQNEKPTFIVKVQYRQNASWQGTIKWVEGNTEKSFRSALELIRLMDEAVGSGEDTGWK